jgi:hypothetical protein
MAKTHAPSEITVAGRTMETNAVPDPFDALDLVYRPLLQLLPREKDHRAGQPVLDQIGQSCTGHAVAALIDTVLSKPLAKVPAHGAPRRPTTRVSPYMLYALARRYDEYPGDADVGSSLRGAFKGWYRHGVCSARTWPASVEDRDLYDPKFVAECRKTPLGAYYRVNARRIDDMQSAITELNAIAVSAAIHEGWRVPGRRRHGRTGPISVIERSQEPLGGHAFLIAGYNDVGFLVQNSWGTEWGQNGYATLPYDDWLDNGYDAWVGRPGVPQVGATQRRRVVVPAGTSLIGAGGPHLARLKDFVVDVTAGGRLSTKGKVSSSPSQIDGLVAAMEAQHDAWATPANPDRRVVLYAHGGLVGEDGGIAVADRMIDWWRENKIYPVHLVWESDPITTVFSFLGHRQRALPFGGLLDGFWEAADRALEGAGRSISPLWEEMKANARAASGPLRGGPASDDPGVTLLIERLKAYRAKHAADLKIHLVGHSAGSVVLASVVERLIAEGIPVESLQLMGGAIRVDDFVRQVVPALASAPNGSGMVRRFATYTLTDKAELDDTCPGPPVAVYHKSLLYFVARSLEPSPGDFEVPMVGLSKAIPRSYPMPDGSVRPLVDIIGGPGSWINAPNEAVEADSRSRAKGHGDFDDDPDTLTSVLLRILSTKDLAAVTRYPKGGMPSSMA